MVASTFEEDGNGSEAGNSVPGALGIGGAAGSTPVGLDENYLQTKNN